VSSIISPTLVRADDQVEAILRAALVEFSDLGFALTTIRSVARRAGVSPHIVRRYFADKEELFRDMVRWTVIRSAPSEHAPSSSAAAHTNGAATTSADEVRRFAHRYWAMMERPEMLALVRLTIAELPRFPELAVFHASESLERLLRELERIIGDGVSRGELHLTDIRASARTVLATLAAHAIWFAYPDIYGSLTGPDRAGAAAATVESLLRSLRGPMPSTGGQP